MIIYPRAYLNSVLDITLEFLKSNNLKGLILDVDNTLIDFNKNMSVEIINWCNTLKENGIKMCILSNTNNFEKVNNAAKKIGLEFFYFAKKPLTTGFKKAQEYLDLDEKNIAVVGDQIFTDILGANRMNMFSILVKPIDEKDIFITRLKRPLENFVINCYIKKKNKGKIRKI